MVLDDIGSLTIAYVWAITRALVYQYHEIVRLSPHSISLMEFLGMVKLWLRTDGRKVGQTVGQCENNSPTEFGYCSSLPFAGDT